MNTQDNRSIEELTQAIELDPADANAHFSRGHAYHAKSNYDKAITDYTKSIKLNPKLAEAYNGRGLAHIRKGDYDQAIKDLNKAIQLNPKLAKAYNNRGTVYRRKGDYDKAIADYTESIKLNPKSAKAYNNRGAAHSRKGSYDQAIEDLNKAIQLNPKSAKAYNNRKELQNWSMKIEGLLHQLRNLASQPLIDQLAVNTREVKYSQLMKMHQTRKLPAQTIQEINGYRQKLIDELLSQLVNLASQPSIDQLALNDLEAKYSQLMKMHQTRKLPAQTIQEINGYRQKFLDERQQLIDKERFDNLLRQLRNLAPSIDQSALNTCEETYSQLIKLHQTLDLPKQILQEINRYRQKFLDGRQKLIYRKHFSDLSTKAMSPNIETCFSLPKLDEADLRLVEKWHHLRRNSLNRTLLINTENKEWELGRLLSARSAEKVAAAFY